MTIDPKYKVTTIEEPTSIKIDSRFKNNDIGSGINVDLSNYQQNSDRYKRFIDEIYPNVDLERQAAQNQTTAGKFGNMFVQGVLGEVLAQGVIGGIGSIIGLPQAIWNEARGGDADFGNFITDFANNITNTLGESSPIFRYNPNKNFDWKDPGYWASSGVSIFSSLGMLLPALGEVKAVSYISKALKALSEVAKVKGVATGLNLAGDVFNTERYWQKLTHSAITMRNAENFRESNQAYNNVYSDTLGQFKDEKKYQEVLGSKVGQEFLREGRTADKNELAKFIASKAAWKDYSVNAINVVFDAMQLAPIFKPFEITTSIKPSLTSNAVKTAQTLSVGMEGTETAIKESFNASKYLKGAKVFLGEQVGEGVEELINAVAQNESNYYGQALLGNMTNSGISHKDEQGNIIVDDKDWTRRLKGYLKDPASWEQAFWGFTGGVVFSGATRGWAKMQEVINDTEDPHSDTKRINNIQNREIVLGNYSRSIKLVLAGINPNSKDGKFSGNEEQIKKQKEDIISGIKTSLGHNIGFESSKYGNTQYLLDWIEHPNFKDTFIKTGITDEINFAKDLATLKQDILDAEHTFKTVYSKIFTDTVSKPWLRELLISQANNIKADVKHTTKLRDKFKTIASNLRTNNPAYDSLKEKNKDNDFDGTLDNLITAAAITALENNIDEYSDETSKKVITERIAGFKQEIKDKHKEIGDKQAVGDFNVIADIIENEALAKINDVYLGVNNSLYEDVLNTKKSVPLLDKDVNDAIDSIHGSQFKNFNKKLLENTSITTEDTSDTIDAKIAIVNDQLSTINTTKEDPYVETEKLTRKLPKKHLEGYIKLLENRKKYLEQQKIVATSRKETINELDERNKATEKSLQNLLDKLKITSIKSKFTGHRDIKLYENIRNFINSPKTNVYSTIYKLITDPEYKNDIDTSEDAALFYEKLANDLGSQINRSATANKINEFINELLMNLSYVITDYTPSASSSTVEVDAKAFKDSLNNNDDVKNAIDWTSENPINKDSVELANKWITGIVNSGDSELFNENNPDGSPKTTGTTFFFEPIAAKYAKLTSIEKLTDDFEALKLAYLIASNNKVNPITKTKRIYNTKDFLEDIYTETENGHTKGEKKISVKNIISKYNLVNEFSDPNFENEEYLKKTGGKDVINTYIFNPEFKTTTDENGNMVVSDKDYDRLSLLLNGLVEGASISVQVNSEYSALQESDLNKNNLDMIPLVGTVEKDGKTINVLSINTIPTTHYGIPYNFKGKDWTDGILSDVGKTNLKSELISRLIPLLQNWYNLHKVKSTDTEFSTALEQLLNNDTFAIINEMLGKISPRSKEGHAALLHITKVIFFGNNTDGKSPVSLRTQTIINNIRNWKSLLYRDHIGNTKLRNTIGTDVSKTITTNIKHITSGSLIHAKDKNGNKKFNKLTVIASKNKVKLFLVSKEAKTVLRNTKDNNETIEKKSGEYSHSIFVGVETNRSNRTGQKIIPVPTINNKLNGGLLNHENDELYLEQTVKLIEQLGASRLARRNAREEKNDLRVEELGKEIDMLVSTLKDVVRVDFKDEGHTQAIISNNTDIRFYNIDEQGRTQYIAYDYYNDVEENGKLIRDFHYERKEGTNVITKEISRDELKTELGKLDRNVNKNKLGNKKYTDIIGNKYNSYEEYLIESNSIVTDIGQVVDSKGNKISNFMPRGDNSFGVPLAINIDTSMLSTSINPRNNFAKFQNDFELDKRYSFIFEVFNQLLQSDPSIKFNGIVAETRKEGGRESYAWLDPTTRAINVSQHWIDNLYKKNKTDATLIIVHEILHALKESRTTEQQTELDKKLTEFKDSLLATPEYIALRDKSDKTEIEKKIISILSMKGTHIDELLTYGLTDRDFARFLDSIQTTSPEGVTSTFWVKLKEIIRELASLFGVNTKLDEINSIFAQFISGQEEVVVAAKEERLLPGLDTLESPTFDDLESDENEIKHASFSSESGIEKYSKLTNYKEIDPWMENQNFNELQGKAFYSPLQDKFIDASNLDSYLRRKQDDYDIASSGGTHYFFEWVMEISNKGQLFNSGVKFTERDKNILVEYDVDTFLRKTLRDDEIPWLSEEDHFDNIYKGVKRLYDRIGNTEISIPELKYTGSIDKFLGNNTKFSSYSSSINQEITNSPFELPQELNILNVLSQHAISVLDTKYKRVKLKDAPMDALRNDIIVRFGTDVNIRRKNGTISPSQLRLLEKVLVTIRGDAKTNTPYNKDFWKLFRIHLANQYGYNVNETEDYRGDVEYLEKSWDQADVFNKNPMDTVNDRIKRLINTTFEVDPNDSTIVNGNVIYNSNTNTPTGFANTLSYNERANKILDLMNDSLSEQDMLDALLKYATTKNSIFAKTLFSIHDKLVADSTLMAAWFTSFDKPVVDSYRTWNRDITDANGEQLTEITISLGNKQSARYLLANDWTNVIVARGETGYYDSEWIKDWNEKYIVLHDITDNLTRLDEISAVKLSELFYLVGIEADINTLLSEFKKGSVWFKENIMKSLHFIKGSPTAKYNKLPYIEQLQEKPKWAFTEFSNLLKLADKFVYYREDVSNHSELNIKGNLVSDIRNHNFITMFFKKLNSDDKTIIDFLSPYTAAPQNQHSFLLWGDSASSDRKGRGIFNYTIVDGKKQIDSETPLNKKNIEKLKFHGYAGTKNVSDNQSSEYHELNKHDWSLETFMLYITTGETEGTENKIKVTGVLPLINPADRKSTMLFSTPIIPISVADASVLVGKNKDTNLAKETAIFKQLRNGVLDEMIAAITAKNLLFDIDSNGRVVLDENNNPKVKDSILNNDNPSQLYYHYKLDKEGNKHYLEFKSNETTGRLELDTENSGNVFGLKAMSVLDQNMQLTFNDIFVGDNNFILQLLHSPDLYTTLNTKLGVKESFTFNDTLDRFVHRFIEQQYKISLDILNDHRKRIEKSYLKKENINTEDKIFILKDKDFRIAVLDFALNTYLFNIEQVRLFYGDIADYKDNNTLNKRGGEVLSNGTGTTLRGSFFGATISDIKLKSKIYRNIAETIYKINTGETLTDKLFNKFDKIYSDKQLEDNKMKFSEVEMDVYNTLSPYLTNDSANAVSLITFAEFEKRIAGFGLSAQYADVIDKVKRGVQLDREESTRFATMQKNFYYDLVYNAEMQKMVPIQIKNAEVVLTPELIKNLELSDVNDIMIATGLSQINLTSAEKVGSFYIATINDKNGKLLDLDEVKNQLTKAKREYKYENLRMQQEVVDSLYEEEITLGRQITRNMITNIPDDHIYILNGKNITGKEVKDNLFALQNSNIHQNRDTTIRPFNVRINRKGHLVGDTSYDKVIEILEKEAINRGLTKNIIYGVGKGTNDLSRVPIFSTTYSNRWENMLTAIFNNGINNQTFPGLHAPQMSSIFMNRKKGITQEQLSDTSGINWLKGRKDTKLKSTIIQDSDELKVIKAEVLIARWASEFYEEGADGKKYIDINKIPEEVRNMIGYRIPTEAKYSVYMFEVVGFLPDDNGPAIILPDDFLTQTGSDFDMDTVYALLYNIKRSTKTEIINDVEVRTSILETVKYLDDESEEALNKRVDVVMDDRKQLVHILSKALMNNELVAEINHLTTMIDQYTTISELNKELHKEEFVRLDVVNQLIKESKGKDLDAISEKYELQAILNSDERGIYYKNQKDYLELRAKVKLILSKLSIDEQNTKKARQNKILDLYTSILSNLLHYPESIAISNFKDISAVAKKIDKLAGITNTNINNFTFEGQQQYRDLSHQGRDLKGISIALNRFNDIAQVAGIKLSETLEGDSVDNKYSTLPRIKYVIKNSLKAKLSEAYGKDIIFENIDDNTSYATVTHRFVGNNPGGTFIGVHGKQINSYTAQIAANVLDNVNHRLPRNVGKYMIGVWELLPSIGSTFNVSTLLVNQPILIDLVDFYDRHTDTMFNGREVEEIKRKYQTLLYRLNKINGGEIVERWDKSINNGQNIFVLNNKYNYNKLGYENETIITLDEKQLEDNINVASFDEINTILASATPDKVRVKQLETHIRYQLQILETYKIYNKYSNAIRDTGSILNTDKIGAGPTFDTTFELLYNMRVLNDSKVLNIDGKSVISQVFPHRFGLEQKSVYPTIETFFEDSNMLSVKLFAEYFTGHSDLYNNIKRLLHDYIGDKKYNKDFAKTITSYFNNALLKDLPWFNDLDVEAKRDLLGIDKTPISKLDLTDPDSQNIFESLSVANQIRLYINQYGHTNEYLDSLATSLQKVEIKRNRFHKILYKNTGNLDTHTQAFNDLWYSENLFERIIARNLIRYDYILNGFTFGLDSFSKVIPNTIFYYGTEPFMEGMDNEKGIGVSSHLYSKLQKLNDLEITTDEKLIHKEVDEASIAIFGSNYKERYLKSHYETNNLVPDAGWIKRFDKDAIDINGEQGQNRRVFTPNPETGIISIPAITLTELATSKASNRIKSREIIKLQFKGKWQLYQRVNSFVNSDEKGNVSGNYYFYPINKLEYFENEQESVFPENNLLPNGSEIQSPDDYIGIITSLDKKTNVNKLIYAKDVYGIAVNLNNVKSGKQTAYTTIGDRAKVWAELNIGNYVRINNDDEYVKVISKLTNISLKELPNRVAWAERNQSPIEKLHDISDNGIAYENRTDIFEFKYIYIGNKDAIVADSNAEYDGEGEISENDEDLDNTSKFASYTSSVSPEINNAMNTGYTFIKTVYENLKVRSGIYKKSVSTKEVVEALNKLDIKEEIFTLELANLSTALIDALNYMNKELLLPRKKEQAGIIARISEFENADMSELVNDPLKRKDFINSMRYTLAFLQGVTIFDLLESTSNSNLTEDEKLVNESIKALQNLTPTLKNVRSKFDRLLKDFSETNLRKYTKNPNILDGTRDIMDPGDDESYIQLQLDSLADTNNPFIALMVKQYSINMIKANDESLVEIGNLEGLLRKTFNKNITSLSDADFDRYLEYKNGKRTGKLIQKYDWDKFYADKSAYFKDIISKYTTESENYYRASKKWYVDNERAVISVEERDAMIAKKEIDLTASEFFKWKRDNLRNEGGKLAVKIGDSAFATPSDKYLNGAWNNIKDDVLYQKFIEIINNYTDHFGKATILNKGFIPSMTVEQKESFNIAEKIQKWISVNKIHKESESYVGENNEMVYVLTVPMVSQFGQEKEIKIDYKKDGEDPVDYEQRILEDVRLAGKGNFKSLIELRVENKRIRKENDEYHAGHMNYNLGEVFSKFIKEANIYKVKAEMKHEFDLALYQTKTAQFYKRDSKGKLIKDKFDSGEGTNLANHYAQWLEAIFYGNWDINEGNITTISKMLLKFTSAKNMWLNLTAGINNVQFGKLQVRLEAVAGWYFKNENLNKADMMYIRAIADIVSNLGSTKAGNLTNAIIKRLDITQNTNERDYTTGMLKEQFMKSSMFYVFNDMGEHYMQNVSALAMADHARIVDGEILSLTDYTFNNYKKALYQILDENEKAQLEVYLKDRFDKDEFKESKKDYLRDYLLALPIKKNILFIEAKKTIDANSKIEFEKYAKLIDAFYLDADGYAQLNTEIELEGKKYDTSLNTDEFEKFKLKALKVVQKEQGIYNRDDAGMVQRRALGKLMIQFRKYMRPGWNKRFGSKFGKSFWTESRDEWDKGMYTSMWHFLKTGFKRNYDMNEAKEVHNMMGKIMKDFGHFATNINVYWGTLDDFEKGNIRRVMLEQLYLVATIVVAMMLKGLKPEDDDDPNMAYDLLVYEIDRLYSNTMMYNPIGLINEGQKILKSPAAVQGTVLDIYKLTSSLIGYPFQTDAERRYKTGVYAKELKVKVNTIKLTPMLNKYQQLMRINKSNKYYILFRG